MLDYDSQDRQLQGQDTYAITFAKGQLPPVKEFWSLTFITRRISLTQTR
jgi:hypothetical protein